MSEWWNEVASAETQISLATLAVRLGLAFLAGLVVAAVFRLSRRGRPGVAPFAATLVLLTVLIALVTLVIGNSVARAFSLVGALAIVRFRTVVEDTRDTAFVIYAVAAGMTVGAGFLAAAAVGVPVVGLAALALSAWDRGGAPSREGTLLVRLGVGFAPEKAVDGVLARHLERSRLVGVATARQGAALELTYQVHWREGTSLVPLVHALNQREGVQGVEVRGG